MQAWTTSARTNLKFCKCFSMQDARWASGLMEVRKGKGSGAKQDVADAACLQLAEGITKPNSHTTSNFLVSLLVISGRACPLLIVMG